MLYNVNSKLINHTIWTDKNMTTKQALEILANVTECLTEDSPEEQRNAVVVLIRSLAEMNEACLFEREEGAKWYKAVKMHKNYIHYSLLIYILCNTDSDSIRMAREAVTAFEWAENEYAKL